VRSQLETNLAVAGSVRAATGSDTADFIIVTSGNAKKTIRNSNSGATSAREITCLLSLGGFMG
jgi:hypothetical protein